MLIGEESRKEEDEIANGLDKALFPFPSLSFPLSLGGDDRVREAVAVVFLSAQTPVITGSIKLPVPAWRLLTTVRTSAPVWSCLATWSPEKKAKETDQKGQWEGGLAEEGDNQEQRALSTGSKLRAAS